MGDTAKVLALMIASKRLASLRSRSFERLPTIEFDLSMTNQHFSSLVLCFTASHLARKGVLVL